MEQKNLTCHTLSDDNTRTVQQLSIQTLHQAHKGGEIVHKRQSLIMNYIVHYTVLITSLYYIHSDRSNGTHGEARLGKVKEHPNILVIHILLLKVKVHE